MNISGINKWLIVIIGSLLGFIISQFVLFYTFTVNIETTKNIEMINLGRELNHDFYDDNNILFKGIRTSVESCENIYKGFDKNGKFDNDEINKYLGFFDDLGFYYKEGVLDIKIIDQFFGAYIVEAYEYNEIRKYVEDMQNVAKQKIAFVEFQAISQAIEKIPGRSEFVEATRRKCSVYNK